MRYLYSQDNKYIFTSCLKMMAVNNTNVGFLQTKYISYYTSYMQYNIVNSQFEYTQDQQIGIRSIQQPLQVQTVTTTQHPLVAHFRTRQQHLYASSNLVAGLYEKFVF